MNITNQILTAFGRGIDTQSYSYKFGDLSKRRLHFDRHTNSAILSAAAEDFSGYKTCFLESIGGKNWSKKRKEMFKKFCAKVANQINNNLPSELIICENGRIDKEKIERAKIVAKRAAKKRGRIGQNSVEKFTLKTYSVVGD